MVDLCDGGPLRWRTGTAVPAFGLFYIKTATRVPVSSAKKLADRQLPNIVRKSYQSVYMLQYKVVHGIQPRPLHVDTVIRNR